MRDRVFTPTPLLTICALSILLCLSCELLKPGEPIEFTTVDDYYGLRLPDRANCVIQDSVSLGYFWKEYCPDTIVTPLRPPHIDFSTRTLICVFMGTCPSSGYSTIIFEVRHFGDEIVVSIAEHGPGPGDVVAAILTHPQHLVTIPKTNLPIGFTYDKMVADGNLD